jgi:hypothetical protein
VAVALLATLLASLLSLAAPAAAAEPFGIESLTSSALTSNGAPFTQAAGHPYQFVTDYKLLSTEFSEFGGVIRRVPNADSRNVQVNLPRGFIVNPNATPARCTEAQLENEGPCPNASAVGYLIPDLSTNPGLDPAPIYNMVPPPGVPAELGFNVTGLQVGHIVGSVRTGGDYGLSATVEGISQKVSNYGATVVLWGNPSDPSHDPERGICKYRSQAEVREEYEEIERGERTGNNPPACAVAVTDQPLITMPSSCTGSPLRTTMTVETWQEPGVLYPGEAGAAPTAGCSLPPFEPSVTAHPDTSASDSPSGFQFGLHVPQPQSVQGIAEADLENATVTLPAGLVINPSSASGLAACSPAQIGLNSSAPPTCPAASRIGEVEVATPLLEHPLGGSVYLATQEDNPFHALLAGYIVAEGSGVLIKLPGKFETNPATGQITASFEENPQLPFEDFRLTFFGGPRAPLTTPATCGTKEVATDLTPWTSPEGLDAHPSTSFAVTTGASGSPCPTTEAAMPNKPTFEAGTTTPIAGSYSPFVLKLSREDGSQRISSLETTLPEGLVGNLAGIPYCSDAAITAASGKSGAAEKASPSCPAGSEVGNVNVGAGSGTPYYVQGKAYLAGPYEGAPFSLAIITPAVAGPFDLGTVVVRTALYVNEYSAQVRAVSDAIPSILQGIPLDIRSIAVQLSRPDFTLNPSSCEAKEISGSVTSTLGQSAPLKNRFQVGACGALEFKPGLKVSLSGQTKRIGHPALKAVLTYPKGQNANVRRALVNLPSSEFLDQGNLNKTCTKPVLQAGKCPASTVYGKAKAWTPLLDKPLEGPVYLVGGFGFKLPALVAELNGQIRVLLVGKVDSGKNHGIRNTFEAVPDAPVSRFVLEMKGGKKSGLLENSQNICKHKQKAIARFTAQNGKTYDTEPMIQVSCGKKSKKSSGKKK